MNEIKLTDIIIKCDSIKEDSNKKLIDYHNNITKLENMIAFERGRKFVIAEIEYLNSKES